MDEVENGLENGHDPVSDDDLENMTEEELNLALESFAGEASVSEVNDLFKTMNEESIISWDEVEHFMSSTTKATPVKGHTHIHKPSHNEPAPAADKENFLRKNATISGGRTPVVKSGLPENVRPSEPENSTNVDECIRRLLNNDSTLTEVNINNMKRTPVVQIEKLINAISDNTHVQKLALSNVALRDTGAECLIQALKSNASLISLNVETNYLSGEFLVRLFEALLINQTLEEIRAANQGLTCSSQCETQIMEAICENETLRKVGLTFRKQEVRHKVDQALFRNNEIRRLNRKEDQKYDDARAKFSNPSKAL